MRNLTVQLNEDSVFEVTDFVMEGLEEYDCLPKTAYQIEVAVEEIVTNVVNYSGLVDKETMEVSFDVEESSLQLKLVFTDPGVPFDPLAKQDPDLSVEARSTQTGGLGIYMVKQMMDNVSYEHIDGKNVLTICKNL